MTTYILIVTGIISVLCFSNRDLAGRLQFHPFSIQHSGQYYRFLSYGFIHADWIHMGVNLFVLYSFGRNVELYFEYIKPDKGPFYYLLLYIGGIVFSVTPGFRKHRDDPSYAAVGASGAVSAVVFSAIVFAPMSSIGFLFLPFEIPAFIFGILYLAYSAYMSKKNIDNIGHDAHFWGAIYGLVFTVASEPLLGLNLIDKVKAALS